MDAARAEYRSVGEELSERILALMERDPQVAQISDPWELFRVEGFACGDLNPSLAQAMAALGKARYRYRERHAETQQR